MNTKVLYFILFACFFVIGKIEADPFVWSPSAPINETGLILENVSSVYDPTHDRVFAAWIDANTSYPTYSIYQNGAWSATALIDPTFIALGLRSVYMTYDAQNDRIFAAWTDISGADYYPTYSIYSNGSWSSPATIDTNIPVVGGDIFLCYANNRIFATWASSNTSAPAFSIYSAGNWSSASYIDAGGFAILNVYTCYNTAQNQVVATWADANNGALPAYSIYSEGTWSAPQNIGASSSADNVFPCYNSTTNEVMATWVDVGGNQFPTYSLFNGTTWSNPSSIAPEATTGFALTLFSCYDSAHNRFFASWPRSADCDPFYSIYSNGSWSPAAFINVHPPGVVRDVFLTYDSRSEDVFATWADCVSGLPYYSIYYDTQPLEPPSHLKGEKKEIRFVSQTEWVNILSWKRPLVGSSPLLYRIYRESLSALIGAVPANSSLRFIDHNRKKLNITTYYITSVDAQGNQSAPASLIVQ